MKKADTKNLTSWHISFNKTNESDMSILNFFDNDAIYGERGNVYGSLTARIKQFLYNKINNTCDIKNSEYSDDKINELMKAIELQNRKLDEIMNFLNENVSREKIIALMKSNEEELDLNAMVDNFTSTSDT